MEKSGRTEPGTPTGSVRGQGAWGDKTLSHSQCVFVHHSFALLCGVFTEKAKRDSDTETDTEKD